MSSTTVPTTSWGKALAAVVGAALLVVLVLLAFLWPGYTSEVKDLPLVVAGPPAASQQLQQGLGSTGVFSISSVADRGAAVDALETRKAYGAVVVGPSGPEVLTASAASPVASQALAQVAQKLQAQLSQSTGKPVQVKVTDVAPLTQKDPRGSNLAVAGLPLAMGGMLGGILVSLVVTGRTKRYAAIIGYALLAGVLIAAILNPWLHVLAGSFLAEWAIISAALLATGALIVGLHSVLGMSGAGLGAALTLLVGNPLSSMGAPVEMLPKPWGAIGQGFVPGAAGTLLRNESYFPRADTSWPWLVLASWAGVGLLLMAFARRRAVADVVTAEAEAA